VTTHRWVFVTARLVDPATGSLGGAKPGDEKSPLPAKLDAMVIPQVPIHEATRTGAVQYLLRKSRDLAISTTYQ
jgi:hypothetical protein